MEKWEMWQDGDLLTAEKLNRMQEIAQEAQETADKALLPQIQNLKLYCDEVGKIWGGAVSSPGGATITFPAALLTFTPITFAPVEPQIEEE